MKAENIKGPFMSNCFLEAIKAKIKHPFKVKITMVPRSEANCPHFLWSDGEYDYDFGENHRLTGLQILLFHGYIRRRELGFNKKYKERMRIGWKKRALKKKMLKKKGLLKNGKLNKDMVEKEHKEYIERVYSKKDINKKDMENE